MSRKHQSIKVVIHEPGDSKSHDAIQQAADELYKKIIIKTLSGSGLTYSEKKEILRRLAEQQLIMG